MEILITDGYTVNPGDLSWEEISAFGNLTVYQRTPADLTAERCKNADIILTNKVPITKTILDQIQRVKMISVMATGYNIVDLSATMERKVLVCNVPAYGTASVAQHTIALILELSNQVGLHSKSVRDGAWIKSPDWSYALTPLIELNGKTLGLVGFGQIGQRTASIARALGMEILYTGPQKKETELGKYTNVEFLFTHSDFISLHCPQTMDNLAMVNRRLISLMKPSAFLINTSRGQLIQEEDLAKALNEGRIAGAALDVLAIEPPPPGNPLLQAKNCIITPHNAWKSRDARQRIMDITVQNIRAFLQKEPINTVG
ncbi:MAG: D-2-hydroxyacid dehydrogenase [Chitinophagales bacterium]